MFYALYIIGNKKENTIMLDQDFHFTMMFFK